jgi:hypothetical protein
VHLQTHCISLCSLVYTSPGHLNNIMTASQLNSRPHQCPPLRHVLASSISNSQRIIFPVRFCGCSPALLALNPPPWRSVARLLVITRSHTFATGPRNIANFRLGGEACGGLNVASMQTLQLATPYRAYHLQLNTAGSRASSNSKVNELSLVFPHSSSQPCDCNQSSEA